MFNIQPGTGLGFTASKQIALGLGESLLELILYKIVTFIKVAPNRVFRKVKPKRVFTYDS